jgi:hypothetical protein
MDEGKSALSGGKIANVHSCAQNSMCLKPFALISTRNLLGTHHNGARNLINGYYALAL